jgi:hypothetical protein
MPDIIIYDNGCGLYRYLVATGNKLHETVGFPVDVFHWKCKHKQSDEACSVHCNPTCFPELLGEDGKTWWFNSSIAEQTNVWMGGYHPIVREMKADKYNYFLDEMIKRKNELTKEKLERDGACPGLIPGLFFAAYV